jgi:MFS family permease
VNRNVVLLALAQAIMMSVNSLMVTSAAIIGSHLASNKALATLPLALQFVAVMLTTIPASMLMGKLGRKAGFLIATAIGLCGALCGVIGIYQESFLLFCIGTAGAFIPDSAITSASPQPRSRQPVKGTPRSVMYLPAACWRQSSAPTWPT